MPSSRSSGSSSADCDADARGAAVEDAGAATGVRDDAELRREHDLVAAALDGPADQLLVVEGAVDLGGVEVGDAQVQRPVDGADGLGVAALSDVVEAGHRHGAESNAGDGESADRDVFYGDLARSYRCFMNDGGWSSCDCGAADLLDRVTLFGQPPSFVLHSSGHRAL
jgi:hypothetical protein